jgi:SAM-dependent methyltransferase
MLDIPYDAELFRAYAYLAPLAKELRSHNYSILRCPTCNLYFQELVADPDESERLYNSYTGRHPAAPARPLAELAHFAEDAMIIRLLFPHRRPVVLDYGMSTGNWAAMTRAYDCEVWGTDIKEQSRDIAQQRGIVFSPFTQLPENHFDFINADQVFEHLAEPLETLKTLANSLKPGGKLKISTPYDRHISAKIQRAKAGDYDKDAFGRAFESMCPLLHLNLFEKSNLLTMAHKSDLSPYRVPLRIGYSAMTLFDTPRQWNRNLYNPFKRWRARGTWQFFQKNP